MFDRCQVIIIANIIYFVKKVVFFLFCQMVCLFVMFHKVVYEFGQARSQTLEMFSALLLLDSNGSILPVIIAPVKILRFVFE